MSKKVTYRGEEVTLVENEVQVGDVAPVVQLVKHNFNPITIGGKNKRKQILLVVPSIEGDVSGEEIQWANKELQKGDTYSLFDVIVVSMDLPFASFKYGRENNILKLQSASDFKSKEFAKKYGVLQANGLFEGLTCRAVFIINKEGIITYKEIVPEISMQPDLEKLKKAARK